MLFLTFAARLASLLLRFFKIYSGTAGNFLPSGVFLGAPAAAAPSATLAGEEAGSFFFLRNKI